MTCIWGSSYSLPEGVEVKDEGLIGDIKLAISPAAVYDPLVCHHSRAAVQPEGRWLTLRVHPPPLHCHQIKLPHLYKHTLTQSMLAARLP